jgi:cytochrome c-type biogenesis protein CcmF
VSLAPLGLLLGFWVALGALAELDRPRRFRQAWPSRQSLRRLFGLPRTAWATALAHFGLGVTVIGIVAATAWSSEAVTTMEPGDVVTIAGYEVIFRASSMSAARTSSPTPGASPSPGRWASAHDPPRAPRLHGQRHADDRGGHRDLRLQQLYVQLGETSNRRQAGVRVWYKPWVTLIWLGCVIMAGAGLLSLSYRRLRVGAPRPGPAPAPAE